MKFFKLLYFLIILPTFAYQYDGPMSAGVEFYKTGEYKVKGEVKCNKQRKCRLVVYPKTSREYTIFLEGDIFNKIKIKDGYYIVDIIVNKPGLGNKLYGLVVDTPKKISSLSIMKSTVKKQ